jgi:release factor glutamine methyltransferase
MAPPGGTAPPSHPDANPRAPHAPQSPPAPASTPAPGQWTTRALLAWMTKAFVAKDLDAPRLCAELLLSHVIGCDRLRLYMDADRPASDLERDLLRGLVTRALAHEPVQYLVGEGWFFSLPFHVDKRVLIPRPSTETIVEHVLQLVRAEPGFAPGGAMVFADVCTGSGCVAVSLLKNLPDARAAATDVSPDALDVARANATRHAVIDRLDLLRGDLLDALDGHPTGVQLHALVSNPPYIPDSEWNSTDPATAVGNNVKGFEPEIALRGGPDGLRFVRPLIEHGPTHLREGGLLMIEIAASTATAVLELARAQPTLRDARMLSDVDGLPRVLMARRA